jgi:DNA-binding IclR family transcriptional regulator
VQIERFGGHRVKEDRQFVTALSRGLEVLRCFTADKTVLGATEIAQMIGLPQPTVWRLCHTLSQTGYLVPTQDGKLRIGAPVLSLGYAALASLDWLQVVRPHMQQMADRFSAAVALCERHRSGMIYLERCQGKSLLLLNLQVGSRIPIHSTSAGWAYLAALPPEKRDGVLERVRAALGDEWPKHQAHINKGIDHYERRGFVLNPGGLYPGVISVAVPVVSPDGATVMALNCGGSTSLFTPKIMDEEIGPALVALGKIIEAHLPGSAPRGRSRKSA